MLRMKNQRGKGKSRGKSKGVTRCSDADVFFHKELYLSFGDYPSLGKCEVAWFSFFVF